MADMRVLKTWAIIISSIVLLSGCSTQKDEGKAVVLRFLNWEADPAGIEFVNTAIRDFENENPDVKIKSIVETRSYREKLLSMIAGGTAPDIFEVNTQYIDALLPKKACLDIGPYMARNPDMSDADFFLPPLYTFRYDGQVYGHGPLYGIPKDWSTSAVFYNKDLFEREGIEYPDRSLTWQEYIDIAKKLTRRDSNGRLIQAGTFPLGMRILFFVYQSGLKVWSEDFKRCLLDQPDVIDVFKIFMYMESECAPSLSETTEMGSDELVYTGKIGMWIHYRWYAVLMEKHIGSRFRWGMAPFIHKEGMPRLNPILEASGWCISSATKHPEEAYRFLKFLVGEKGQIRTAREGWNIPSMKRIAYSEHFLGNTDHPEKINKVFMDEIEFAEVTPVNPLIPLGKFNEIVTNECTLAKLGKKDIAQALKDAVMQINSIIEENLPKTRQ